MDEIAAACPDEEWLQPTVEDSLDVEFKPWYGLYLRAFDALQCDRFYGASGGQTAIYYTAISRYASDHEIEGDEFRDFLTFINAIDAEHLAMVAEELKALSEKEKVNPHG